MTPYERIKDRITKDGGIDALNVGTHLGRTLREDLADLLAAHEELFRLVAMLADLPSASQKLMALAKDRGATEATYRQLVADVRTLLALKRDRGGLPQ